MKTLLSWSSGKDSAWSLHVLRQRPDEFDVVGLLTTTNEAFDRVAMHAVREQLLRAQAEAVGVPLTIVPLPWPCSNEEYEARMTVAMADARTAGVQAVAFGDLYLADVRAYREQKMADTGICTVFPVWQLDTTELAHEMIAAGVVATLTCVDPRKLPGEFAGRRYDERLLADLAALDSPVDPCGENGEFHTFVHDGPMFQYPVAIQPGEVVERDGFVFADLLPVSAGAHLSGGVKDRVPE